MNNKVVALIITAIYFAVNIIPMLFGYNAPLDYFEFFSPVRDGFDALDGRQKEKLVGFYWAGIFGMVWIVTYVVLRVFRRAK